MSQMYLTQKIKNSFRIILASFLLVGLFTLVAPAQSTHAAAMPFNPLLAADDSGGGSGGGKNDGTRNKDPALSNSFCNNSDDCKVFRRYINPFITLLAGLVGLVAVIAIIIGAIEYSSAGGDPQKAASGKNHIRKAIIGLVAFVFFYAFMQWVIPGGIGV